MQSIQKAITDTIASDWVLPLGQTTLESSVRQQRASFLVQCASLTFGRGRAETIGVTRNYSDARKAVFSFLSNHEHLSHLTAGFERLSRPVNMALVLSVLAVVNSHNPDPVLAFLKHASEYGKLCVEEEARNSSWLRRTFSRRKNFRDLKFGCATAMSFLTNDVIRSCYPKMHRTAYASFYAAMEVNFRHNFPSIERFITMYGSH